MGAGKSKKANHPSHHLLMKRKRSDGTDGGPQIRIGCAWETPSGLLSLRLNPGTVISWRDMDDYLIGLFPNLPEEER